MFKFKVIVEWPGPKDRDQYKDVDIYGTSTVDVWQRIQKAGGLHVDADDGIQKPGNVTAFFLNGRTPAAFVPASRVLRVEKAEE